MDKKYEQAMDIGALISYMKQVAIDNESAREWANRCVEILTDYMKSEGMKKTGRWEYDCLIRDMKLQGEDWSYKGGFEAWYEQVFLEDDAWREIRESVAHE